MSLKTALALTKALLHPRGGSSTSSIPQLEQQQQSPPGGGHHHHHNNNNDDDGFHTAPTPTSLFPPVNDDDGDGCDHDCHTCTATYPRGFKIDETEPLYGRVKGWGVHLVVATGRSDWVRDVADEKGSLMEAVRGYLRSQKKKGEEEDDGGVMVSASNMPVPVPPGEEEGEGETRRVLVLPAWRVVEGVIKPGRGVGELVEGVGGGRNMTGLGKGGREVRQEGEGEGEGDEVKKDSTPSAAGEEEPNVVVGNAGPSTLLQQQQQQQQLRTAQPTPPSSPFDTRPCPHNYLILLCSHRTRDARCGQSAPLLRKEFERQLRPLGLYRDLHDERPGGVGIYFINHVGGHKFSANVMVYRRAAQEDGTMGEASQCIWLARVRPEDCEGIVRFTVLQGKVVKPQRQLRGGFDREKGLVSW